MNYKKATLLLILLSTFLRVFLANQLEFGNDEVYYWLYAKYPDISHFDHPSFVGFFIQFFTLDLYFDSELAIRLASIIPASISMYVVFLIGKYLKNDQVGFIAVLLYNISIYGFIIAGVFVLPDAPLVVFWLLSFYFLLQSLPKGPTKNSRLKLCIAFFFIGCAIYSKYQAVFLLLGVALYVVFVNRNWLKDWSLYVALLFPVFFISLIVLWNYNNDFISYTFHNNRVSLFSFKFNKNSFLREWLGQVLYNNPYIYTMLLVMMSRLIRKKFAVQKEVLWIFLFFSLPLIFTTLYLSLFRDTFPHWSGLSYITLLPLLALFINRQKNSVRNLKIGFAVFAILCVFTSFIINEGWFLPKQQYEKKELYGRNDVTLDMYGWEKVALSIADFLKKEKLTHLPIVSDKWFPAAHIDYYIAHTNHMNVYGIGGLNAIHKYYWINKKLPSIDHKKNHLYITDSRNYRHPKKVYSKNYQKFQLLKTFPIKRNHETVKFVFLYKLTKNKN